MSVSTGVPMWSKTQVAALRECGRKYALMRRAVAERGDDASRTRSLSSLKNRHLWAGALLHESVGDLIKTVRMGEPPEPEEAILDKARARMRDEFVSSKDGSGSSRLFEHAYALRVERGEWKRKWESVERGLRWFSGSPWLARLRKLGPESWKAVDEVLSFDVGGIQAYVKIDCAVVVNGRVILIDWVTGALRETPPALAIAALYAHEVWEAQPDEIDAFAVSLADGTKRQLTVDEETLMEAQLRIQEESLFLHDNAPAGDDDPMSVPMTDRRDRCTGCNFRGLCHPDGLAAGFTDGATHAR